MKKILLISFILFLIVSCNSSKEDSEKNSNSDIVVENIGVSVTTHSIKAQPFQKQIIANGLIDALQKSELRFKTSDRLASIKVKNGDKVYKGQVLATLDNAIIGNQLNKSKLEVDKANSKLQEEKINFGIGNSSNETIGPNILKNLQIKSGYLEAKNALENAQLQYNQTILKLQSQPLV